MMNDKPRSNYAQNERNNNIRRTNRRTNISSFLRLIDSNSLDYVGDVSSSVTIDRNGYFEGVRLSYE